MKRKPHHRVIRTSISLPPALYDAALDAIRREGFTTFSDYIQDLIRRGRGASLMPQPAHG